MQVLLVLLLLLTLGIVLLHLRQLHRHRRLALDRGLAVIEGVLDPEQWSPITAEVGDLADTERSYLPGHKKDGTIAYETLIQRAPHVVGLYLSKAFQAQVSGIVGETVVPTLLHDQSSLSVLRNDKPGDHIGRHSDHNFHRGRHFTVLLSVENRGTATGGLSHASLMVCDGEDRAVATPPNTLVVFEGARVLHKVTPILDGERRVVISMTYCTDPRNVWWQVVARRVKDIAFYGPRALWT